MASYSKLLWDFNERDKYPKLMSNLIDLNLSIIRTDGIDNKNDPLTRSVKIKHIHSASI
ncbi:MAG: Mor family transcriptional regulator [Shewanella psychromarinicola]|jgi:Mor family transcriptional regulator